MVKAIIWTIISALIIIFTIYTGMASNWFGLLIVIFAVANIIIQWLVYNRQK